MALISVWTRQHRSVVERLMRDGRYAARAADVEPHIDDHDGLVLRCYQWLAAHLPTAHRPADADYPVWLTFRGDAAMLPSPGTVLLELEVDERLIVPLSVDKWGMVLNYSYLPADERDALRHRRELALRGTNDAHALMTPFEPELRREILESWTRLFDDRVQPGDPGCYGLIWELRADWVRAVRP